MQNLKYLLLNISLTTGGNLGLNRGPYIDKNIDNKPYNIGLEVNLLISIFAFIFFKIVSIFIYYIFRN